MINKNLTYLAFVILLSSCGGDDKKKETEDAPVNVQVKSVGDLTIGYYEMEKISTDFDFYVDTQKELEGKKKIIDDKIAVQQKAYENAAIALQKGMNSNTLTPNQAQGYQAKMQQAEEAMMRIQQTDLMAFEQESLKANEVLMNKMDAYAQAFAEKNQLKLFLSKAVGGQIAYIDSTFNMTNQFIEFMNKKEDKINEETAK